jgi:hypothetical protein
LGLRKETLWVSEFIEKIGKTKAADFVDSHIFYIFLSGKINENRDFFFLLERMYGLLFIIKWLLE